MDCRLYRRSLIALFAATCSLHSVQVQAQQQNSQRWRDSLTVLNQAIATQPWSTDLHLRKAAANLELKQWNYAIDEYNLVLQKEPRNAAAMFYRAYANTHLRRFLVISKVDSRWLSSCSIQGNVRMHWTS